MAVVGDGRSGDPLHERDDKRDVYEGEVSEVDTVMTLAYLFFTHYLRTLVLFYH